MAKNTNEGTRVGSIKERTQYYNEKNKLYIKRDTTTGKFISSSKNKYKSIRLESNDNNKKTNK